ncbi:DNA polymerase epsilon catalytic subunit [Ascosphaera aggregata]|nr:DNA polymerase epsilon catalytic subunit [Ascosphaera aggregata]
MNWQLSKFLPKQLEGQFVDWVAEYIVLMCNLKNPQASELGRAAQFFRPLTQDKDDIDVSTALRTSFAKPLKKAITQIIRRQRDEMLHPELASDYEFPRLPGSSWHDNERNPALEFVKFLMQVISLSKTTTLETRMLRKELLSLFDVREFSDQGRFENPSGSLKLVQLICSSCTMTRDLDLCRDADILLEEGNKPADKPWLCLVCHTEFNRLALEERMVGDIQAMITEWATQDLRCKACGALRASEFMEYCSCGGAWGETLKRETIEKKLKTFESIGEFYELEMLKEVSTDVLRRI